MTAHDKHFDKKKPAAVLKNGVLSGYLVPFATMISTRAVGHRVWLVDAYAGAGKFDDGSDGSPLIATKVAEALSKFKTPRDVRCVFIEKDPERYAALMNNVNGRSGVSAERVLLGKAEDHLPEVMRIVGKDPVLTFLDPFGTSLPRDVMIDELMSRPKGAISEVLLNFHIGSVARIGALTSVGQELEDKDKRTAARLDSFLGYSEWRETFTQRYQRGASGTATAAALEVSTEFRRRIEERTGYHAVVVEVRRGLGQVPLFELTLFHKSDTPAAYKFADAASTASAKWRKKLSEDEARDDAARHDGTLALFDGWSEAHFAKKWAMQEKKLEDEWVEAIRQRLVKMLEVDVSIPLQEHILEILGDHIGLAGEKHIRRAWKALATAQLVNPPPTKDFYTGVIKRSPS